VLLALPLSLPSESGPRVLGDSLYAQLIRLHFNRGYGQSCARCAQDLQIRYLNRCG
jgi:hypothetical protein